MTVPSMREMRLMLLIATVPQLLEFQKAVEEELKDRERDALAPDEEPVP